MDDYTNNLHARIDNILTDAYFDARGGGVGAQNVSHRLPPEPSNFYSNLLWLVIGVVIGVIICYVSLDDDTRQQLNLTQVSPPLLILDEDRQ